MDLHPQVAIGHTRVFPRNTTLPAANKVRATDPQWKQASPCSRAILTLGSITLGEGMGGIDIPGPICSDFVRVRDGDLGREAQVPQ